MSLSEQRALDRRVPEAPMEVPEAPMEVPEGLMETQEAPALEPAGSESADCETQVFVENSDQSSVAMADCVGDQSVKTSSCQNSKSGIVLEEKYRLEGIIGQGGMGTVYKGWHLLLNSPVAVKILHRHLISTRSAVERFMEEARTAHGLKHPNLVSVLDFGFTGSGEPFIVMEYIEGQSLAERLKKSGPLSTSEIGYIFTQVCGALEYAHARGIVHRDIKPSNILISEDLDRAASVKVVDFGICKVLSKDDSEPQVLTHTGQIFGSPYYMSPEQCRGADVDARTDIYSVGIVIFECLTGRVPFVGSSPIETLMMHCNEPTPQLVTKARCKYAAKIRIVLEKALQKDPDARQQSAGELKRELEKLTGHSTFFTPGYLAVRKGLKRDWRLWSAAVSICLFVFMIFAYCVSDRDWLMSKVEAEQRLQELLVLGSLENRFDRDAMAAKRMYYKRALKFSEKHFGLNSVQTFGVLVRILEDDCLPFNDVTIDYYTLALKVATGIPLDTNRFAEKDRDLLERELNLIDGGGLLRNISDLSHPPRELEDCIRHLRAIEADLSRQLFFEQSRPHDPRKLFYMACAIEDIKSKTHYRKQSATQDDRKFHDDCIRNLKSVSQYCREFDGPSFWDSLAYHLEAVGNDSESMWLRLKHILKADIPDLPIIQQTTADAFVGRWLLKDNQISGWQKSDLKAKVNRLKNGALRVTVESAYAHKEFNISFAGTIRDGCFSGTAIGKPSCKLRLMTFNQNLVCDLTIDYRDEYWLPEPFKSIRGRPIVLSRQI